MATEPPVNERSIEQVIGTGSVVPYYRRAILWIALGALLAGGILLKVFLPSGDTMALDYRTAPVVRGDLTVSVTATGVLEPVNQVDVGTEISGMVKSVEVDFNDRVVVGQVLARLDTDQLEARLRQSQAALTLAQASVTEAEATVKETRNRLNRSLELKKQGLCSQEDCDSAQAAFDRAEAALAKARAQVTQARAQLDAERTTLDKAVIRSPIAGIVLKRQIESGQTVAASFQTPVLFTLAENLAQMELKVAVDEADVGMVKEGLAASFTVDAYPQRSFPATITQVRYAPETVDGVVTYESVLSVDNSDLTLRPGMTATSEIIVRKIPDTLLVPNAALRFKPPVQHIGTSTGFLRQLFPRHPRASKEKTSTEKSRQAEVWVLRDGQPGSVVIATGDTDGVMTQVLEGELQEGTPLLVDMLRKTN